MMVSIVATTALDAGSATKDSGTCSSRGSDPRCMGVPCVCYSGGLFVCGVTGLSYWMMFHGDFIFVFVIVVTITQHVVCVRWVHRFILYQVGLQ